ncbi:MAG: SRPBCC family protein [Longimicrobiales bacterium]
MTDSARAAAVEVTDRSQTHSIAFEVDLAHPPRKVWRALTEPALLSEWLLPVLELELRTGASLAFRIPAEENWGGRVNGRFLEIEPERKLSYTWTVDELETVVSFALTPTPTGTRLSLVQSGFQPGQKRYFGGARHGWRSMWERLVALLERGLDVERESQ